MSTSGKLSDLLVLWSELRVELMAEIDAADKAGRIYRRFADLEIDNVDFALGSLAQLADALQSPTSPSKSDKPVLAFLRGGKPGGKRGDKGKGV